MGLIYKGLRIGWARVVVACGAGLFAFLATASALSLGFWLALPAIQGLPEWAEWLRWPVTAIMSGIIGMWPIVAILEK